MWERVEHSLQKPRSGVQQVVDKSYLLTLHQQIQLHSRTCSSVTSGDGEALKAWHPLMSRWDLKLRSRSAGILLELMRFDVRVYLLCKMEEYERSALTFENVSGESVSQQRKSEIVLNRLGESELASQLVMTAEGLKEWHKFLTEVVNATRARPTVRSLHPCRAEDVEFWNSTDGRCCGVEGNRQGYEAASHELVTTVGNLDTG